MTAEHSDATPIDLTRMLAPERGALLDLLSGLTPEDWRRPTECPAWDVKGLALHILGDDLSLLSRQRDASTDSLTLFAADHPGFDFRALLDGFNEQWVTASSFLSTALVVEILRVVGDASDAFYRTIGLATIASEPVGFFAATDPSPYWQVIAREYVERVIHQSQIRRATGAPEVPGELLSAAALVMVHALATWIRGYAPDAGATIAIEFGPVGSWTWRREAGGWSVHPGRDPSARACISVRPEHRAPMLTRGLSSSELPDAVMITGDETLARGALDIVAPLVGRPPA